MSVSAALQMCMRVAGTGSAVSVGLKAHIPDGGSFSAWPRSSYPRWLAGGVTGLEAAILALEGDVAALNDSYFE